MHIHNSDLELVLFDFSHSILTWLLILIHFIIIIRKYHPWHAVLVASWSFRLFFIKLNIISNVLSMES